MKKKWNKFFIDGMMKWWEQDSGQLQMSTHQHSGWVTDFLFMSRPKLFFSSAHDGVIIIWGCGGNVVKKIRVSWKFVVRNTDVYILI